MLGNVENSSIRFVDGKRKKKMSKIYGVWFKWYKIDFFYLKSQVGDRIDELVFLFFFLFFWISEFKRLKSDNIDKKSERDVYSCLLLLKFVVFPVELYIAMRIHRTLSERDNMNTTHSIGHTYRGTGTHAYNDTEKIKLYDKLN